LSTALTDVRDCTESDRSCHSWCRGDRSRTDEHDERVVPDHEVEDLDGRPARLPDVLVLRWVYQQLRWGRDHRRAHLLWKTCQPVPNQNAGRRCINASFNRHVTQPNARKIHKRHRSKELSVVDSVPARWQPTWATLTMWLSSAIWAAASAPLITGETVEEDGGHVARANGTWICIGSAERPGGKCDGRRRRTEIQMQAGTQVFWRRFRAARR
jgi:hypothetical protein